MTDEITPKELFEEVKYLQTLKDIRLLILMLHLYIGHFINEIAKEKGITKEKPLDKVEELISKKVIDEDISPIVKLVYRLRNKLVHTLRPNQKLLEKWIEDFKLPFHPLREDAEEVFSKGMSILGPWEKIQIYSIPVVINLFKKIKETKQEKLDYDIEIHWNTALNIWGFKFVKLEEKKIIEESLR